MAEQLILLDPTEEVFGKCLKEIANGTITVAAAADFPIGEKYPAGTVDKLIADFLEHHEVEGLSHTLPYPRVPVDKNQQTASRGYPGGQRRTAPRLGETLTPGAADGSGMTDVEKTVPRVNLS